MLSILVLLLVLVIVLVLVIEARVEASERSTSKSTSTSTMTTTMTRRGRLRSQDKPPKTKRPRKLLRFRGQLWEWAFATRSFPAAHAWALSLSRAVCFPTPLSAACGCIGLMAGPS